MYYALLFTLLIKDIFVDKKSNILFINLSSGNKITPKITLEIILNTGTPLEIINISGSKVKLINSNKTSIIMKDKEVAMKTPFLVCLKNNVINNSKENKINCFYLVHAERKDIGKLEIEPNKSVKKEEENGK